ncbi:glycosyltransferase [Nocardia huaxiensis]|uniref:Glycosyltransferase family 1 protein n=1 Tax=Nocardia huaxiensis TaxID=2755382 RepID=A0A7D6VMP4_9NOCA|nr:glycosyltransferase [Nocardia huaxiensis]QLY33316.1 glycosyltransferase family 1 protein [Nocardia huaxiensis]UFS99779.1 glycosyltransferase [Nocardia huaxiensis]
MRIAIPLTGTRGDVHPVVALGIELRRRGHDVLFGAPPNLVDFVKSAGLAVQSCGPDIQQLYSSEAGQQALAAGNTLRLMQLVAKQMAGYAEQMNREVVQVCAGADLIVASTVTEDRASSVAEAMGVPLVSLHYFPCRANSAYPFPGALPAHWSPPAAVNRVTWTVAENLRRIAFLPYLNALRADLGLRKSFASPAAVLARAQVPEIQIYDPALVPGLPQQWDARRPFTGFLTLDDDTRAAVGDLNGDHDGILRWIDAGEPPVFFGFGSMPIKDAAAVLTMVDQVSARLGVRALVSAGWSDLDIAKAHAGEHVRVVGDFAHDRVFPRCLAAVHHGGIGTLFESLRAGLPTLVCSVSFDQPMWGGQVTKLGIGAHLKFTELTAERLEQSLAPLLTPEIRTRVSEFAGTLRPEGGAHRAADIIEAAAR